MATKTFTTSENPRVEIEAGDDLYVSSWEKSEVQVIAREDAIRVIEQDGVVRIICNDDCTVTVPQKAEVVVRRASGDLDLIGLANKCKVEVVGGDLTAQRIDGMEIRLVGGDCDLRQINGQVSISNVGGDLLALEITGSMNAGHIGGDADLNILTGTLEVRAGGDVQAYTLDPGEGPLIVGAGGDVKIHLPAGLGLTFDVHSGGSDIELDFEGQEEEIDSARYQNIVGDGKVLVRVEAGGDVEFTDRPWNVQRHEKTFDAIDDRWTHWEEKMIQHEALIKARVEQATRRAAQASRRAEERVQEAMRRVEQKRSLWGAAIPVPPVSVVPPQAPEPRVSEEERTIILQMLQEKKISAEEAERLLEALEG